MTGRPSLDGYRQCRIAVLLIGALWLSGCAMRDDQAPRDADPVEAYTRLGEAYLARDDLQRASEALGHALELAPGDAEARQAMAMVHQRRGDDALAEENFRAALHDDPDLTRARNNYAAFLYDRGRIREACHQLQRASKDTRYINRGQLLVNLGRCQRATGDEAAARASFEQALRIDPGRPGAICVLPSSISRKDDSRMPSGTWNVIGAKRVQIQRQLAWPTTSLAPGAIMIDRQPREARPEPCFPMKDATP